jgi:hypothetical protein
MATVLEEEMCVLRFLEAESIIKIHVVTQVSMQKIHLQMMLPDVGYSSLNRLVVSCIGKERESRALLRKILIRYSPKNQLD